MTVVPYKNNVVIETVNDVDVRESFVTKRQSLKMVWANQYQGPRNGNF